MPKRTAYTYTHGTHAYVQYLIGGLFVAEGTVTFADLMRSLVSLLMMALGLADVSRDASDRAGACLRACLDIP